MNKISEAANRGFTPVLSLKQLVNRVGNEDTGATVTINGFGYVSDKKGEKKPVLYCSENVAFWATNAATTKFVNELLMLYDKNVAEINADFRYTGVKIQIGPLMKLENGNSYWPITKIADVDFEPQAPFDDTDDTDENPVDDTARNTEDFPPF